MYAHVTALFARYLLDTQHSTGINMLVCENPSTHSGDELSCIAQQDHVCSVTSSSITCSEERGPSPPYLCFDCALPPAVESSARGTYSSTGQDVKTGPGEAVEMCDKGYQVPLLHQLLASMRMHHQPRIEPKLRLGTKVFVRARVDLLMMSVPNDVPVELRVQTIRCAHGEKSLEQFATSRAWLVCVRGCREGGHIFTDAKLW